jgi:mRNA-degrading endonuclease toxin of MazEF toxin-antitoxin module
VASLHPGRIVYSRDPLPDPQGRNPKEKRPFAVISDRPAISQGMPLDSIGITGEIKGIPTEVPIRFGPNCKTGMTKASVALCTWRVQIPQDRAKLGGLLFPDELLKILQIVRPRSTTSLACASRKIPTPDFRPHTICGCHSSGVRKATAQPGLLLPSPRIGAAASGSQGSRRRRFARRMPSTPARPRRSSWREPHPTAMTLFVNWLVARWKSP